MTSSREQSPLSDPGPDILARERGRFWRRSALGRFLFSPWSAPAVVAAFLAVLLVPPWLGGSTPAEGSPSPGPVPVVDSGRDLLPGEVIQASTFGRPLYLGDSGRPVIRHAVTGEVRELTPFEQDWGSFFPVRHTGVQDIVESPGPRGHGLWWRDRSANQQLSSYRAFGRHRWRQRQQAELSFMVSSLSIGADVLFSWHGGYVPVSFSDRLARVLEPVPERYPYVVRSGRWVQVPARWRCSAAIETALSQGLSPGCPSPVYLALLDEAWVSAGLLLEDVYQARSVLDVMDSLDSVAMSGSGLSGAYASALLDVARSQDRLDASLRVLWARSLAEDLPIYVELP